MLIVGPLACTLYTFRVKYTIAVHIIIRHAASIILGSFKASVIICAVTVHRIILPLADIHISVCKIGCTFPKSQIIPISSSVIAAVEVVISSLHKISRLVDSSNIKCFVRPNDYCVVIDLSNIRISLLRESSAVDYQRNCVSRSALPVTGRSFAA